MKKAHVLRNIPVLLLLFLAMPAAADLGPRLERTLAAAESGALPADGPLGIWVFFEDKNLADADVAPAVAAARAGLSRRALERRQRVLPAGKSPVDLRDVPVAPAYIEAVGATGARLRRESRWLNAASFDADAEQIRAIAGLPFVRKVELVITFRRPTLQPDPDEAAAILEQLTVARDKSAGRWDLDYGMSTVALEQINVPPVHELGLSGAGVIVAELDAGFVLSHECLQHIPILAQYDFVHDDGNVQFEEGDHGWQHRHGSQVLSTLMGFREGELVGPAYGASVILAMTEDTADETQIEEDNWVAAVEWVEGLGADMITSSLGYYYWYTYEDLDGDTAVTTVAADMAVERGLPVFTSAGNERDNPDFPHVLAPADGDSVIACGAVDQHGAIAGFSSPGPTVDGRIKPDVSALGVGNIVADYYSDMGYVPVNGTSFAAPLVAGVAALMLERVPSLTPMQIREALRQTASMAATPNNDYGWGIIDAYAAATYWGAAIAHTPLNDTEDVAGPYTVSAEITSRVGLVPAALALHWRLDGGAWNQVALTAVGGGTYAGDIPGQAGGLVEYYLEAGDRDGIVIQAPHGGPAAAWSFVVGTDLAAPVLTHYGIVDQVPATWPPLVTATAADNQAVAQVVVGCSVNGGPVQGPFPMIAVADRYELPFPLDAADVAVGDVIQYTVTAYDIAAVPNATVSGPWEFRLLDSLAQILVIDNSTFGTNKQDEDGAAADVRTPGTDLAQWLTETGYDVTTILPLQVNPAYLAAADAVLLTCSNNSAPLTQPLMRAYLIDYVESGGKILVEGGAVADVCLSGGAYTDFAHTVLRADGYLGAASGEFGPSEGREEHPVLVRPNILELPLVQDQSANPYDFAGGDGFTVSEGSLSLLSSIYNSTWNRSVVHDDNTGPEAGQIIFHAVAFIYLEPATARALLENSMAYLLAHEAPGNASISGSVTLVGSTGAEGVTVTCGAAATVVTGPDGAYSLQGLHGSTYTVTASRAGYGPVSRTVVLGQDEAQGGVDFILAPITEVNLAAAPEAPIPDFNQAGVTSVIHVAETGTVNGLDIDIDIAHPSIGQLVVTLLSPAGTSVTLHDRTGATADDLIGNWPATLLVDGPGSLEDFQGESVQGDWTLSVVDGGFGAIGTFHGWGLNLLVAADAASATPDGLPRITRLLGNAPNPFNPRTQVVFELARPGRVELDIFDVRGHRVHQLLRDHLEAGVHEVAWDGRDDGGLPVSSGVYFCRMQSAGVSQLIKMALVR